MRFPQRDHLCQMCWRCLWKLNMMLKSENPTSDLSLGARILNTWETSICIEKKTQPG
jgi:hypothetical protein